MDQGSKSVVEGLVTNFRMAEQMGIIRYDGAQMYVHPAVFTCFQQPINVGDIMDVDTGRVHDVEEILSNKILYGHERIHLLEAGTAPWKVEVRPVCIFGCGVKTRDWEGMWKHYTDKEHDMASTATGSFPTHPSNRSIIERMEMWGWKRRKSKGGFDEYVLDSPQGPRKILVRRATYHDGNPMEFFHELYRVTTNGDAGLFWNSTLADQQAAVSPAPQPDVEEHCTLVNPLCPEDLCTLPYGHRGVEQGKHTLGTDAYDDLRRMSKHMFMAPKGTPKDVLITMGAERQTQLFPETGESMSTASHSNRGTSTIVFDYMADHRGPRSVAQVAQALNIDRRLAGNAMNYLSRAGLLVRIKQGVYRVSPSTQGDDVHVGHSVRQEATVMPLRPEAVTVQPSVDRHPASRQPQPAVVTPGTVKLDDDEADKLTALLDLLAPDGFKAHHLKPITEWMEATKALLLALRDS